MPRIQAVKNFTALLPVWQTFSNTNFGFHPDEAVVRSISYIGPNAKENEVFLIWCSLINDFIGSFTITNYGTTVMPNTLIVIPQTQPFPASIEFRIMSVDANGVSEPAALVGNTRVSIDFIKYRA